LTFAARTRCLLTLAILACAALAIRTALADHGLAEFIRLPPPATPQRLPPTDAEELPATPQILQERAALPPAESLDVAWATALAIDPWLDAYRYRTSAAGANVLAAQSEAGAWMDVGAGYSVRDNDLSIIQAQPGFAPATLPFLQRAGANYFATVGVPIYTGGAVPAAVEAAQSRAQVSELETCIARHELRLRVAEEFIAVLRATCEFHQARVTVTSLEAHAKDVEMFFRHDQRPRTDLLAAQVALSDARQLAIVAENRLLAASAAYNRRLGRPLDAPVYLQDLALDDAVLDLEPLVSEALENREELGVLAAEARALSLQAESIAARNRPQAAITGSYIFNENQYQTPNGLTTVGVGVVWNAFDAGRDRHRATALQQQSAALHRMRADQESRIRLEVHRAWLDRQETRRRLTVTAAALGQAEENARVARERYANGMGTSADVLASESLRAQSFRNHHHAWYDAVLASLRLDRALGR
jgi:outer membrane protein TolC